MRVLQAVNPLAVWKLRRVLDDFRPDLVHIRMFMTQLSPFILPLCKEILCLYHVGSLQSICPINTKILPDGSICRLKAGRDCYHAGCLSAVGMARVIVQHGAWHRWRGVFRAVVANSQWLGRRLREDGIKVSHVILNGTPVTPPRPPIHEPPIIGFAGRLVPEKGVSILLASMVQVIQRMPACRLLIAGEGPGRREAENHIDRLGLRSHVSMLGYLNPTQLAQQLETAWVQAVPSSYEDPFPNVILEAMMRGTAVVATAIGGATEMVREGETGFLVEAADSSAMAAKLLTLLENRGTAERMGAAGRAVALAEFTDDRMVEDFLGLYADLVAESKRPTATL
jgi:glycosyltransferase involved in cell wall biosynthesis